MSQLHTRSTQSKRLSRPHISTTPPLRLTPPKLLSLLMLPQSTLSLTPQLLPSLLPQLLPVLDTLPLPQLLLPPTLLPQLPTLSLLKQLNKNHHHHINNNNQPPGCAIQSDYFTCSMTVSVQKGLIF